MTNLPILSFLLMKHMKIIVQQRYANANDPLAQYPHTINEFLFDKQADINNSLRINYIEIAKDTKLQSFPIKLSDRDVRIASKMLYETNAKDYLLDEKILSEMSLYLINVEANKEIFREKIFSGQIGYYSYESLVLGYIPSPFDDSIAVLLAYVERGYDGPPHSIHFQIIGASQAKPSL